MVYELKVKKRTELGKKNQKVRAAGGVPGIVYGAELKENLPIIVGVNDLEKAYSEAGESTLINMFVDEATEPREVLLKEISYNAVTDRPEHADFLQIKKGQKLEIDIELEFVGIAPAVKELGGIIIKTLDNISVRCLAKDMISKIIVDLTSLKTALDKISIRDLNIPKEIEVLDDLDETVVVVSMPREEKEEVVVKAAEPEVVGGEKKEGEAAAAAAPGKKDEKKDEKKK